MVLFSLQFKLKKNSHSKIMIFQVIHKLMNPLTQLASLQL